MKRCASRRLPSLQACDAGEGGVGVIWVRGSYQHLTISIREVGRTRDDILLYPCSLAPSDSLICPLPVGRGARPVDILSFIGPTWLRETHGHAEDIVSPALIPDTIVYHPMLRQRLLCLSPSKILNPGRCLAKVQLGQSEVIQDLCRVEGVRKTKLGIVTG